MTPSPDSATEPSTEAFEPNPEAVRRISVHLWGEDMRNVKAAIESFPNEWTAMPKAEARAASVPPALDVDELREAIEKLPNHWPGGYEWEWNCDYDFEGGHGWDDDVAKAQHNDELISRQAVLDLIEHAAAYAAATPDQGKGEPR